MGQTVQLLDCTLRDGGYLNDWCFGRDNLVSIFERLVDAGIDILEIGFLDERRPFDCNRSIMPDTESVAKIYGSLDRKNTMIVGMIDYGTCSLKQIQPCRESFLDGIRVIFKKHLRRDALSFCSELKKLGYKVFAQLVSVTSYSDEELLDLIALANEVRPYAVSMVDTYGLMHQNNLMHYFELLNSHLHPDIGLGYHGHNNFQMGYANCIAMLSNRIERPMIVDGSLYGMGKSAGNAPLELIAMHMNHNHGKSYQISQILEAIDANISQFYRPASWGYNMFYYLAASNDCHPNYVAYLMDKQRLSVKSVNEILSRLEGEKKLLYDRSYIEQLYLDYQNNEVNDALERERLSEAVGGKRILVLGPGSSMVTQRERVEKFICRESPLIISINYIPEGIRPDYVFISNSKRYVQQATRLTQQKVPVIATSNITPMTQDGFSFTVNYGSLIDTETEIVDNSMVMLLKLLASVGCRDVVLAGFDGYTSTASNYFDADKEYDFMKNKADYLNGYASRFLAEAQKGMKIRFITDTRYSGAVYEAE